MEPITGIGKRLDARPTRILLCYHEQQLMLIRSPLRDFLALWSSHCQVNNRPHTGPIPPILMTKSCCFLWHVGCRWRRPCRMHAGVALVSRSMHCALCIVRCRRRRAERQFLPDVQAYHGAVDEPGAVRAEGHGYVQLADFQGPHCPWPKGRGLSPNSHPPAFASFAVSDV